MKNTFIICSRSKWKSSSWSPSSSSANGDCSGDEQCGQYSMPQLWAALWTSSSNGAEEKHTESTHWIPPYIYLYGLRRRDEFVLLLTPASTMCSRWLIQAAYRPDPSPKHDSDAVHTIHDGALYRHRSLCVFDCLCIILLLLYDLRAHILMLIAHSKQQISCLITYYTLHYKSIVFFSSFSSAAAYIVSYHVFRFVTHSLAAAFCFHFLFFAVFIIILFPLKLQYYILLLPSCYYTYIIARRALYLNFHIK